MKPYRFFSDSVGYFFKCICIIMDFHWSFPFIIAILFILFIVSYANMEFTNPRGVPTE